MTPRERETENSLSVKTSMTLRKGATFHSASRTSSTSDATFVPPCLSRSQTHLDDVVDANRRRMALTLDDIEEALSKTERLSISSPDSPRQAFRDNSLPLPRGFLDLPVVDPAMAKDEPERRVLRPRSVRQSKQHASDSGLGSSVASTREKLAVGASSKATKATSASAITRSAASSTKERLPSLSRKAVNRIHEHILRPLLAKPTLNDFEPIVVDIPRRINAKEIICLRDLEKTLIFMAPVSQLLTDTGVWGDAYRTLRAKEKAKSAAMYLDFCLTSIRCIQATVEFISDREQVRPDDRPYTNGYFVDLKEQIYQYGKQLAAKDVGTLEDALDLDKYVPCFIPLDSLANSSSRADEVKLYGGFSENGRPAELVRIKKDGTMISLANGKAIDDEDGPIKIKRSMSEQREDEEEIMRSMARRKKNASPEELAPKQCREPGCNKEFKRPCDLTKHEKTHSRPWKCPLPTCKYHDFGWPTEKEMDRHVNDKHSDAPAMYECLFKPCPYKSKRESNCKQHMEKAHGWTYVRTKTNGKKLPGNPASSVQQTPPLGEASTPSTTHSWGVPTPPQDNSAQRFDSDFPLYQNNTDWLATFGLPPDAIDNMDLTLDNPSSSASANQVDQYQPYQNGPAFILNDEDIYAATVHLPPQALVPEHMYQKMMPQNIQARQVQQQCPAPPVNVPTHFSPNAQHNAVLYTPNSLRDVDECLDDSYESGEGADFQLFSGNATKRNEFEPLFGEVPSANLGFSQTSQQDIFQQIDWANIDCQGFPE